MIKIDFEYVDESSIDENYKCSICSKPFQWPVTTPCDHSYCQHCIEKRLSQDHLSCPICHQSISSNDLIPITTRLVLNVLDKLPVKCSQCNETEIQRGNLNDHMTKFCPKTIVKCTAFDVECDWSGTRNELENHLSICNYERLRPLLSEIINKNHNLEEQIQTLADYLQILQRAVYSPASRLITFNKLITVENKVDSGPMPEFYEDLRWINIWFMHEQWVKNNHSITGWKNAYTHNHNCVIFNGKGKPMKICSKRKDDQTFSLISFQATSAWHHDLEINIIGKYSKQEIYSKTIILEFNHSKIFHFDWKNLDEIKFIPIHGVQNSETQYEEKYFALTWILVG